MPAARSISMASREIELVVTERTPLAISSVAAPLPTILSATAAPWRSVVCCRSIGGLPAVVAHDKGQVLLVQFAQHILSIDAHQTIGACTQPDLCRTLDGADAVAGVDTLYQSRCVVTVGRGVVEDNIHAGLVERNGVERRQDTHIRRNPPRDCS